MTLDEVLKNVRKLHCSDCPFKKCCMYQTSGIITQAICDGRASDIEEALQKALSKLSEEDK